MVAVRHLTKGSGSSKPIYRGLGSIDFLASARSVLLAGNDPDDPETRGIVHLKCNLAPRGDPIGFKLTREYGFQWLLSSTLTAGQILSASDSSSSALEIAKIFLLDALDGGAQVTDEVRNEASSQGISYATLRNAQKELHVISKPRNEKGRRGAGKWYMWLPKDDQDND